jgi:tetratricopeptide (TPR) repeat protein
VPLSRIADERERAAFAIAIGDLLFADGDADAIVGAIAQVNWQTDNPLTPIAHGLLGRAHMLNNDYVDAVASYQTAYEVLERPAQATRVNALRQLGYVHTYMTRDLSAARRAAWQARFETEMLVGNLEEECGKYDLAHTHYIAALAAAQNMTDNSRLLHDVYCDTGRLLMRSGHYEEAVVLLEKAVALGRSLGLNQLLALTYNNLTAINIMLRRFDAAVIAAQHGMEICDRLNLKSTYHHAGLATNMSEACHFLGRHDEALRFAQMAIDSEEIAHLSYAYAVIGMSRRALGELDASQAALDRALSWAEQQGDRYAEASALREFGLLYRAMSHESDAQGAFAHSAEIFDALGNTVEADRVREMAASAAV